LLPVAKLPLDEAAIEARKEIGMVKSSRSQLPAMVLGLVAFFWLLTPSKANAGFLTGAVQFSTDSNGTFSGGQVWNTFADIGVFNLYVTQANSGINGAFLNSGNTNPATRIHVELSAPGTYTFYMFGQPGFSVSHFGLNLFFNSDDVNPGISVFAPLTTTTVANPPFSANSSSSTPRLQDSLSLPFVSAAGTLVFSDGATNVRLTDYGWSDPAVKILNRVQAFNNTPDGVNDFVGHFTLEVTAVPEPGSLTLFCIGAVSLASYGWRRRRNKAA
jgi:hypothetical protein